MRRTLASISTLALAGFLAACGGSQDSDTSTTPTPIEAEPAADVTTPPAEMAPAEPAPAPEPAAPAMDPAVVKAGEADMAAFLSAANKSEMEAAKMAKKKAKHKDVKAFAQMMLDEHGAAEKSAMEVFTKASITPAEGDLTRTAMESSKTALETLKAAKKGADFDRAYVDGQVAMHQQVLAAIDEKSATVQNADLKTFVEGLRPSLAKHLEQAQALQAALAAPAAK